MTRPNPNRRVREARRAREIRDWQKLGARNRERRDKPEPVAVTFDEMED